MKPVTIPKAELTGAHLLAKLLRKTADLLDIPLTKVFAWTDSEIVLHWLPKSPPLLDRFVANRVFAVQQLLPDVVWRHVCSADNPADLASRGVRAEDLIMSALWWLGPPWLLRPQEQWPKHKRSKPATPILLPSNPATYYPKPDLPFCVNSGHGSLHFSPSYAPLHGSCGVFVVARNLYP